MCMHSNNEIDKRICNAHAGITQLVLSVVDLRDQMLLCVDQRLDAGLLVGDVALLIGRPSDQPQHQALRATTSLAVPVEHSNSGRKFRFYSIRFSLPNRFFSI